MMQRFKRTACVDTSRSTKFEILSTHTRQFGWTYLRSATVRFRELRGPGYRLRTGDPWLLRGVGSVLGVSVCSQGRTIQSGEARVRMMLRNAFGVSEAGHSASEILKGWLYTAISPACLQLHLVKGLFFWF